MFTSDTNNQNKASVSITVRLGQFGDDTHTIVLPLSDHLLHELSEPLELSDEPISILLKSWPMQRDYTTYRKRKFQMREGFAQALSKEITKALINYFGRNDKMDGYSRQDLAR
jgi:hypothetical protein